MDINAERELYYLDNHNAHHHQKDEEHPPTSTKNVLELWQTCVIKFIINNAIKIKLNRNYFRFVTQSSSFPPILLLGLCVLTNGPPPALCIVGNIPGIPGGWGTIQSHWKIIYPDSFCTFRMCFIYDSTSCQVLPLVAAVVELQGDHHHQHPSPRTYLSHPLTCLL